MIGAAGGVAFPPHVTILHPTGPLSSDPDRMIDLLHRAMDATMLQRAVVGRDAGGEGGGKVSCQGVDILELTRRAAWNSSSFHHSQPTAP